MEDNVIRTDRNRRTPTPDEATRSQEHGYVVIEFAKPFKGDRFPMKVGDRWMFQIGPHGGGRRFGHMLRGEDFEFAGSYCPAESVRIVGLFQSPYDADERTHYRLVDGGSPNAVDDPDEYRRIAEWYRNHAKENA